MMQKFTIEYQEIRHEIPLIVISWVLTGVGKIINGYVLMPSEVVTDGDLSQIGANITFNQPLSECRHFFPDYQEGFVYGLDNAHVHRATLSEMIADTQSLADELWEYQVQD